ncbi:hypothetical protein BX666DRAFT_238578 [Dichotomocladium elegans]|nr:hypothetical protein BX666DRAFT_238578 [Dichotomocladium elegans]
MSWRLCTACNVRAGRSRMLDVIQEQVFDSTRLKTSYLALQRVGLPLLNISHDGKVKFFPDTPRKQVLHVIDILIALISQPSLWSKTQLRRKLSISFDLLTASRQPNRRHESPTAAAATATTAAAAKNADNDVLYKPVTPYCSSHPTFATSSSSFHEDDDDDDDEADDDEENPVNEARVNRMIEDLEISNRSLLAVNAMLEATVRKQASEAAKMRSQINGEVPFVVPPLPPTTATANGDDISDDEWEKDETFCRLLHMTEKMIEQGQAALSYEVKGLGRVLAQYEQEEGKSC